jgi:hypothetical protein
MQDITDNSFEPGYIDEADRFKYNPLPFLKEYYTTHHLPSHFAMFDDIEPKVSTFLQEHHYKEVCHI